MVVPVVIGKSSFDYKPLRAEQSRLAKTLVVPSPRDKDDTSRIFEVEDSQPTPFKYPTFVKVFFDRTFDLPRFELWMKDNFDQEYNLSQGIGALNINDDPLTAAVETPGTVPANFVISPITGEIRQGGTLQPDGTVTGGTLRGTVKFDGVTGLALAAINNRIADVSNSIEGVTKVLQVVGGNLDGVINLIR